MTEFPIVYQRKIIARLVFSYILIFLIYRFFINATPSNLLGPPLKVLNFDFTYWVYQLLHLQDVIVYNQTGGEIFDIVLFASCILCILFPSKNGLPIIFGILFFIYAITYNTYIVSHSHPLAVTMLITIPFFFKQDKYWKILWEGMRYYICYIYTISFVWKVFIGKSFFFWDQGINSFKLNLVEYLYHFPATTASSVYKYFITNPYLLNIGHLLIVLLEGVMVIGFFTKKYDRQLMIVPVLIHGATYFAADVFFMEMLVGVFTFLSIKNMVAINKKNSFLTR
jgi:hypothetical protein